MYTCGTLQRTRRKVIVGRPTMVWDQICERLAFDATVTLHEITARLSNTQQCTWIRLAQERPSDVS
jgi:hypothetical protein